MTTFLSIRWNEQELQIPVTQETEFYLDPLQVLWVINGEKRQVCKLCFSTKEKAENFTNLLEKSFHFPLTNSPFFPEDGLYLELGRFGLRQALGEPRILESSLCPPLPLHRQWKEVSLEGTNLPQFLQKATRLPETPPSLEEAFEIEKALEKERQAYESASLKEMTSTMTKVGLFALFSLGILWYLDRP